jgi:hypothetical protein
MSEPTSPTSTDFEAAARRLGTPGVVTQWTENGKVRRQIQCLRVGQLALGETMLFVLEAEKVLGWVYLAEIRSLRIESRRSYKHPFVGAALGLVMLVAPIAVIASDPNNLGKSFGGDFFVIWGPILIAMGAFTLYEALFSRKRPWLIVTSPSGEQAFMFSHPLTQPESALIESLAEVASKSV